MTTFIEQVYEQIADIRYISTDDFSRDYLGKHPSYYRSLKSRHIEASTTALLSLLEALEKQATILKSRNSHPLMHSIAQKYEELGNIVCEEIAKRVLKNAISSAWTQKILIAVTNNLTVSSNNPVPIKGTPIIIY